MYVVLLFLPLTFSRKKTNISEESISHGPSWGDTSNGKSWIYKPKGFIKKIVIVHGFFVDGIKFYSSGSDAGEIESSHIGGMEGRETDEIIIDYPDEYLTSISGSFVCYDGYVIVGSLRFATNHSTYGPYGHNTFYAPFSYEGKGVIVGLHGRVSEYLENPYGGFSSHLEAIGIYVMPKLFALGLNSTSADDPNHELCCSLYRIAMPRPKDAGPCGAFGGTPWDDGVFSGVKKVILYGGMSLKAICAIQFEYVKRDATSVLSPVHGGSGGDAMKVLSVVNLDGTDEYLTGISGFYGPFKGYDGTEAIMSITFHTNKTTHGRYGEKSGVGFNRFSSIVASCGKMVGFHGRNDGILSAIGVHMEYF